jgi:hypothetical protein
MTINHVFFWASASKIVALRSFYRAILQPLGYAEMIHANKESLIGYGSDYPYFWLQRLPEGKEALPTHIAFDAPSESLCIGCLTQSLMYDRQRSCRSIPPIGTVSLSFASFKIQRVWSLGGYIELY